MDLDTLFDSIYSNREPEPIEKTAEARLYESLLSLEDQNTVSENPYESLSLEELTKLAQEAGLDLEEEEEEEEVSDEDLQKVAMDTLGGQTMAHAAIHEMGLIKEALLNGKCRICKTHDLDVEGMSVCSECQP